MSTCEQAPVKTPPKPIRYAYAVALSATSGLVGIAPGKANTCIASACFSLERDKSQFVEEMIIPLPRDILLLNAENKAFAKTLHAS